MRQCKEKVLDWVNFGAIESGIEPYSAQGLEEHYLNNSRCWDKNASRYHNNIIIPLIDYGNTYTQQGREFFFNIDSWIFVTLKTLVFLLNCAPHLSLSTSKGKFMSRWYLAGFTWRSTLSSPTSNVASFVDFCERQNNLNGNKRKKEQKGESFELTY